MLPFGLENANSKVAWLEFGGVEVRVQVFWLLLDFSSLWLRGHPLPLLTDLGFCHRCVVHLQH